MKLYRLYFPDTGITTKWNDLDGAYEELIDAKYKHSKHYMADGQEVIFQFVDVDNKDIQATLEPWAEDEKTWQRQGYEIKPIKKQSIKGIVKDTEEKLKGYEGQI